jgi:hypothetical protein
MPLTALKDDHSATASTSRVQTIREGLATAHHRRVWIRAAEARLEELDIREAWFGLEPFEAEEAHQLRALVKAYEPAH